MGFRQWVIGVLGGEGEQRSDRIMAPPSVADSLEEEAGGLNFRSAIDAHQKWKARLQAVINGDESENLSADVISRDDQCVLGKWIHGVGGQLFGTDETFKELHKNHVMFHQCAGRVLKLAQAGAKTDAQDSLKAGEYAEVSRRVTLDLAQMYHRAASKQN